MLSLALLVIGHAQAVSVTRVREILAMSPEQMASTGAWTHEAYDRVLGQVGQIQDPSLRGLVLDMVLHPASQAFHVTATQSFLASPASASRGGHHAYPGGLGVHVLEWLEVARVWSGTYRSVYGVQDVDTDLVVASLVLHDWGKVWFEWDGITAQVIKPLWYPPGWGEKARFKWMGDHAAVVLAELYARGAPPDLIVATAAAHHDPSWDLEVDGEGLNPALAEAARLAGKPAIVVDPQKRRFEWWFSTYTDEAWSFSHNVAGPLAADAIDAVAQGMGMAPGSPDARRLAWFVLTRVSDFRLYEIYQDNGFRMAPVEAFVRTVIEESAVFENPG